MSMFGVFGTFFNGIFLLYIASIAVVIFLENKDPARTLAWMLILFLIPVFGFLMYLVFGGNYSYRIRTKLKTMKKADTRIYWAAQIQKELLGHVSLFPNDDKSYINNRLLGLLLNNSGSPFTVNNEVKVLTNGVDTFSEIIKRLESAQDHIHMEYFIIKDDEIGNAIRDILIRKAANGVSVRIIYDSVGCWKLGRKYIDGLRGAGAHVFEFFPVIAPVLSRELNYRNHRKILVVDGEYGFLGGLNIGDEYLGKSKKLGFWRDTHMMIRGEGVYSLQDIFLNDWEYVSKSSRVSQGESSLFPAFRESFGSSVLQVASSGPDSDWKSILQAYFTMITTAEERIWITTPYLVPEESLMMALKTAALCGRDVRIIIAGRMDHFFVYWASKDNIDELLKAGVRIFSYDAGFIHSKIMIVDGIAASVGTANLDIRSLEINFEVNAFIYDEKVVSRLEEDFIDDMRGCEELTLDKRAGRPMGHRVLEALGRLVSPLQ
jgi:cardiolipin synthase A/B